METTNRNKELAILLLRLRRDTLNNHDLSIGGLVSLTLSDDINITYDIPKKTWILNIKNKQIEWNPSLENINDFNNQNIYSIYDAIVNYNKVEVKLYSKIKAIILEDKVKVTFDLLKKYNELSLNISRYSFKFDKQLNSIVFNIDNSKIFYEFDNIILMSILKQETYYTVFQALNETYKKYKTLK